MCSKEVEIGFREARARGHGVRLCFIELVKI